MKPPVAYKKIYVCLSGSGKTVIGQMLREKGVSVVTYSQLSKQDLDEYFKYRKILLDNPKSLRRIQVFVNEESALTNKMLRSYSVLLYAENRMHIPDNPTMCRVKNICDYYIDYREFNGRTLNHSSLMHTVDVVLNDLIRKMR